MNFLTMEYFLAVARHRNFTKASRELHITQQTLSAHIANLERELNTSLFLRNNPLELTYAGEVFLEYAFEINEKHRALTSEFAAIGNTLEGELRIGIATTRGQVILPEIISSFREEFPRIKLAIIEDTNEALCRKLIKNEADLAIARFPNALPGIEIEPFYSEEIVMFVPKAFGIDAELDGNKGGFGSLCDKGLA